MSTIQPEAQVIVDTAIASVAPQPLGDGDRFFAVTAPEGAQVRVVDLEESLDKYRDAPRHKVGAYVVHDVPSFAAYFDKHRMASTEVWADAVNSNLTAVLDANDASGPLFEQHKLAYAIKKTDAWKAWSAIDGKLLDQVAFAEHIEARAIDVREPSSAAMLDIAQTFEANTAVEFQSGEVLSSGERKLTYKETTTAKAGQTGSVDIPKEIHLGLVPFEGADAYKVIARFRYRITGGKLLLGVVLERPEDVLREAFNDVVEKIETAIQHTILRGSGRA